MRLQFFAENSIVRTSLRAATLIFALSCAMGPRAFAADPAPGAACSVAGARLFSGGPELSGTGHWLVCSGGFWTASLTSTGNSLLAVGTNAVNPNVQMEIGGGLRLSPGASGVAGRAQFGELLANGTQAISLRAPDSIASDLTLVLPATTGTTGWSLLNVGNGTLAWGLPSGGVPTYPLLANPLGSASAPAYSFSTSTNTGMYSPGVGTVAIAAAGTAAVTVTNLGNVGIGTTSPTKNFQIGTTNITSITSGEAGGQFLLVNDGGAGDGETALRIAHASQSDSWYRAWDLRTGWANNGDRDNFGIYDTYVDLYRLTVDTNGNVGIGSTTPQAKLQVEGAIKFGGSGSVGIYPPTAGNYSLRWPTNPGTAGQVLSTTGTSGILSWVAAGSPTYPLLSTTRGSQGTPAYSFSSSTNTGVFAPGVGTLAFTTAGTEAVRITNLGNVGIGTTTPGARLEVAGNITARAASSMITAADASGFEKASIYEAGGRGYFHAYNGGSETIRLDSGGHSWLTGGSVGIGTTNPTDRLTVRGSQSVQDDTSWPVLGITGYGTSGANVWTPGLIMTYGRGSLAAAGYPLAGDTIGLVRAGNKDGALGSAQIYFVASENQSVSAAGGRMQFMTVPNGSNWTGMVERMRIDNDGRVGIGTSTPGALVEVAGQSGDVMIVAGTNATTLTIRNLAGSTNGPSLRLENAGSGGNHYHIYSTGTANGPGAGFLQFSNVTTGQSPLAISPAGSVGIGTIAPSARLDVSGKIKLGTNGSIFSGAGTCTAASTSYTAGTPVNFTCTGVPATTAVAVNCSPTSALAGYVTARATGTANQIAITTGVTNTFTMTCMWMAP